MVSEKERQYAYKLVNDSLKLKKGEKIWIEARDVPEDFVCELLNQVRNAGGLPFVNFSTQRITRQILEVCEDLNFLELKRDFDLEKMKKMDCFLSITAPLNPQAFRSLSPTKLKNYNTIYTSSVHLKQRVNHTRWLICNYPSQSLAMRAQMSFDEYADFLLDVCLLDYAKMGKALVPLKKLMEQTDKVRILGNGTDLTFSIKGMKSVICAGDSNIPDGEIYTAPIKESVNGVIAYNAPSVYDGKQFFNIKLEFQNGKIVNAVSSDSESLNEILDTDDGARFVGEFALGVNPKIHHPVGDILFDEKIAGSLHFTPGNSYKDADNGNKSAIHWDLVLLQTKDYGGGEIWFDDMLIRKDGKFMLEELQELENLA